MTVAEPELAVAVDRVTHFYGGADDSDALEALADVSLGLRQGEFVAIVGPSGCGKTTLLNMIAGVVAPTHGTIEIECTPVNGPRLSTGYLFARDGLFPWRTAVDNVAYGLEMRGVAPRARLLTAKRMLELVGLAGFEQKYRSQLSQGMRQRVSMARTLAIEPRLLLLDEPFAALDAQTKATLQRQFLALWEGTGTTVLLVTHDLDEAIALADRVVVMSRRPGRIVLDAAVDLPHPRDPNVLIDDPRYRELRRTIRACFEE